MPDTSDNAAPVSSTPSAASSMASAASSAATAAGTPAASPSSTPSAGTAAPASPAPATDGAAATGTPAAPAAAARGPIPFDRHEAALRNIRQQYAAFEGMDPKQVRSAMALVQRLQSDPRAFWQQLAKEIGQGDEPEEKLPEPDLVSEDKRLRAYSADALQKYWSVREKQLTQRLMGDLQPFIEGYKQDKAQQTHQQQVAQQRQVVNSALTQARTMPHFKENEKAIAEKLEAMDPATVNQVGLVAAMYMAYNAVLAESVLPGYAQTAEEKVREENRKKAGTQGTAHPAAASASQSRKLPTTQRELAAHMERLASEGIPAGR